MARKPSGRHSNPKRDPVTIDLDEKDVTKLDESASLQEGEQKTPDASEDIKLDSNPSVDSDKDVSVEEPTLTPEASVDETSNAPNSDDDTPREQDAGADSKPEDGVSITPAPQQKSSKSSGVVGGIVGAVLAVAGVGGASYMGLLPQNEKAETPFELPQDVKQQLSEVSALKQQLAALSEQVSKTSSAEQPTVKLAPLQKAIDANKSSLEGVMSGVAAQNKALSEEITALKQAISQGDAGDGAGLKVIEERVTKNESLVGELKTKLAAVSGDDQAQKLIAPISEKLAALEASVNEVHEANQPLVKELEALKSQNTQLGAKLTQELSGLTGDISPLKENATAAQTAIASLNEKAASLTQSLSGLSDKVSVMEQEVAKDSGQKQVAQTIAATALKSAIDRGAPFMSELETYSSLTGENAAITTLRGFAAKGVPSASNLSENVGNVAYSLVDATRNVDEGAGLVDRLFSSAKGLVKSRPVGAIEGESPDAIIARFEVAIKRGDYATALKEYADLPEKAQKAGAGFIEQVKARQISEKLIDDLLSQALHSSANKEE